MVTAIVGTPSAAPERVHPDDWAYAGCPYTGPTIATGNDGSAHVAWYTGKQGKPGVYYARRPGEGGSGAAVELASGPALGVAHPAVASLPDGGAFAAYDVTRDGERVIRIARLGVDGRKRGTVTVDSSEGGKYPQLAVLSDTLAVVGWTASVGDKSRVHLARVTLR